MTQQVALDYEIMESGDDIVALTTEKKKKSKTEVNIKMWITLFSNSIA